MQGTSRVGSVIGNCYGSSIANCWWTSTPGSRGFSGSESNCAKVTEEVLKVYVNKLGTDYFTEDDIGKNDGFPILKWEKEKCEKENA